MAFRVCGPPLGTQLVFRRSKLPLSAIPDGEFRSAWMEMGCLGISLSRDEKSFDNVAGCCSSSRRRELVDASDRMARRGTRAQQTRQQNKSGRENIPRVCRWHPHGGRCRCARRHRQIRWRLAKQLIGNAAALRVPDAVQSQLGAVRLSSDVTSAEVWTALF